MSGSAHRGQEAEAVVIEQAGSTNQPVGLLQGLSGTVSPEYQTLTGAGTNKVIDVASNLVEPEISPEFGTFTEGAWKTLINYDDVAGGIQDTSDVPLFRVEVTIPSAGGTDWQFAVVDCRPDSVDFDAPPDSHASLSLSFIGQDIEDI